MVKDSVDLASAGILTTDDGVVVSIEVLVVEEINPMVAVFVARGVVQMEGGHRTVEPVPVDVVTDPLMLGIKIETSDAPAVAVSAVLFLVTV
jgi:hypothetical protein